MSRDLAALEKLQRIHMLIETTERERDEARAKLHECQAFIVAVIYVGDLEVHRDGDPACPEDETCTCPLVAEVNRLLNGYKP